MEDKDKIIEELKADIKELGSIIECKNGTIATLAKTRDKLKAENVNLREKMANIERITREGFKDYYYTYAKNNPFFLNIIKEIEK